MENRVELYEKTCNTLIDAWLDGELRHGDCEACAVGNICGGRSEWENLFYTWRSIQEQNFSRPDPITGFIYPDLWSQGKELIISTGYSVEELAQVEYAFESSIDHNYGKLSDTPEGQYIGLCAVMEVLWDIHGIQDRSLTNLNAAAVTKGVKELQDA